MDLFIYFLGLFHSESRQFLCLSEEKKKSLKIQFSNIDILPFLGKKRTRFKPPGSHQVKHQDITQTAQRLTLDTT